MAQNSRSSSTQPSKRSSQRASNVARSGAMRITSGGKRRVVAGYHDIRRPQDLLAARREGTLIGRVAVVLRLADGKAPGVRAGHHAAIGLDQPGDVLRRMAGRYEETDMGRRMKAVAAVVEPQVAAVGCPRIHHVGVREEGGIERVIRMVMGEEHVRDLAGL